MVKPITIRKKEFEDTVVNAIESSGLPAFVVRQTLAEIINGVRQLEARQYEADAKAWSESQNTEVEPEAE